jgi:hypothetical protein
MRSIHWLFLISAALFVSSIGLVIAAARTSRQVPAVSTTPTALVPVASVKQIMKGIVAPAATVVYQSVGTIITPGGTEERAPKNDEEWEAVVDSAASLIEAGNLLMLGTRAVDKDEWIKWSEALIAGGKDALKAAQARSAEGVLASGEGINTSCDECHRKYQRGL